MRSQPEHGPKAQMRSGATRQPDGSPLAAGQRLTRVEFERRYALCPTVKKAELIEGIVRMPSPVRYDAHAKPHAAILGPMIVYAAHTPGVGVADNATVRLDPDNEPQPDVLLRVESPALRQSVLDTDGYIQDAPELVAEVAATSASYDLHEKLLVYQRNGVREYIVWRTRERRIDWFELGGGKYQPLPADPDGVIHSRIFPGLRIAVTALLEGDIATVLAKVREGLRSSEHREFVARLGG